MDKETAFPNPSHDCDICPRLHNFIQEWRGKEPDWFNGPVNPFLPKGGHEAIKLLMVGLAPGLRGANATGRPFTGDKCGPLLYGTLQKYGFAEGNFDARPDDGLILKDMAIINAVRCVPPQNKPLGSEIRNCRQFLSPYFEKLPNAKIIVTLGRVAHETTLRALGIPLRQVPFVHGQIARAGKFQLISSYHCSHYNISTKRLTVPMFHEIFAKARQLLQERQ